MVVALLLPFATLYYGFSQQGDRESDEDRAEKAVAEDFALQRKLARAEAQARLRQVQVAGLAGAARAGAQAWQAARTSAGAAGPVATENADEEEEARRPLGLSRGSRPA